ncbi:MAG: Wzz/FepE/Etk N-terminal domain-containing protein, partial [Chitinophagaceae bacterium]
MTEQVTEPKFEEDEISLKELILKIKDWYRYLVSKWLTILIAGLLGAGMGLLYSIHRKPIYTATLTFALEEKGGGSSLSNYAGLASQFGINFGGGSSSAFSEDNIMALMKSRLLVTQTLLSKANNNGREESLADFYININHYRKAWKNKPELQSISFSINANMDSLSFIQDSLLGIFYEQIIKSNLTVNKPDTKSSLIEVQFKSINELFSKEFTENLVRKVSAFYISTKTKQEALNVDILQNRLDSVRREFTGALYGTASA